MIIALWSFIFVLAIAVWVCLISRRSDQETISSLVYRMEGMVHKTDGQAKLIEELERVVWKHGYGIRFAESDIELIKNKIKDKNKK